MAKRPSKPAAAADGLQGVPPTPPAGTPGETPASAPSAAEPTLAPSIDATNVTNINSGPTVDPTVDEDPPEDRVLEARIADLLIRLDRAAKFSHGMEADKVLLGEAAEVLRFLTGQ